MEHTYEQVCKSKRIALIDSVYKSLQRNNSLLCIRDTNLNDFFCIGAVIQENPPWLTELSLASQKFGLASTKLLSTSLRMNSSIESISITGSSFSNSGVLKLIASTLSNLVSLRTLDLSENAISDYPAISSLIQDSQSLEILYLDKNKINGTSIGDDLARNTTLKTFSINHNPLSLPSALNILKSLPTNVLESLFIQGLDFSFSEHSSMLNCLSEIMNLSKLRHISINIEGDEPSLRNFQSALIKNKTHINLHSPSTDWNGSAELREIHSYILKKKLEAADIRKCVSLKLPEKLMDISNISPFYGTPRLLFSDRSIGIFESPRFQFLIGELNQSVNQDIESYMNRLETIENTIRYEDLEARFSRIEKLRKNNMKKKEKCRELYKSLENSLNKNDHKILLLQERLKIQISKNTSTDEIEECKKQVGICNEIIEEVRHKADGCNIVNEISKMTSRLALQYSTLNNRKRNFLDLKSNRKKWIISQQKENLSNRLNAIDKRIKEISKMNSDFVSSQKQIAKLEDDLSAFESKLNSTYDKMVDFNANMTVDEMIEEIKDSFSI